MNTLAMEHTSSRSMFYSNPVLTRLSRVTERVDDGAATYAGIASKTAFFLLITLVGVVAQLMAKALFAGAPVWQTITIYEDFTLALSKPEAIIFGVITTVALINIIRVNSPLLAAEEPSVYNSIIYGRTDQEDVRKRIYTYIAQCK